MNTTALSEEVALIRLCLKHGYAPAVMSVSLADMKLRDAAHGGLLLEALTPDG